MTFACNLTPFRKFLFIFVSTTVTKSSRPNAPFYSGDRPGGFLIYRPLIVPVTLLDHYVRKIGEPYLKQQVTLNPHPMALKLRNHA